MSLCKALKNLYFTHKEELVKAKKHKDANSKKIVNAFVYSKFREMKIFDTTMFKAMLLLNL